MKLIKRLIKMKLNKNVNTMHRIPSYELLVREAIEVFKTTLLPLPLVIHHNYLVKNLSPKT